MPTEDKSTGATQPINGCGCGGNKVSDMDMAASTLLSIKAAKAERQKSLRAKRAKA